MRANMGCAHQTILPMLPIYLAVALPLLCNSVLLFLLALYAGHELWWKRRLLPPGPTPWFIAGNMPQLLLRNIVGGVPLERVFVEWKRRYGPVFTFWMGPIPMVMVGDVELMKRYFGGRLGEVFSGRWQNFITHTFMDGHNGVVQIQGDKWREQRRFSLHVLRDFGLGRAMMEEKIWSEVEKLMTHMDGLIDNAGSATIAATTDLTKQVAVCIANIINNILFGCTYEHGDKEFIRLQHMLDQQSALVVKPIMGLYLTFPSTVHVPLLNYNWRRMLSIREALWGFLDKHLKEHHAAFDEDQQSLPTDFTYAYMAEMERRRRDGDSMGYFDEKQLKMLLLDLFFAGSETTVTTTKWGLLLLILHPEWQGKCQLELDSLLVARSDRRVELKDRSSLITLQATICEIQRMANILPINLLRTCTTDIWLDGYFYREGTMVLPQISIAMSDPERFSAPGDFNPARFIGTSTSGKGTLRRIDSFLPFSIGKRQCLGESLAKAELFLIFANLLANYEFSLPDDNARRPTLERVFGLTSGPRPFQCKFRRRVPLA